MGRRDRGRSARSLARARPQMFNGDWECGAVAGCIFGVAKGGRYFAEMTQLLMMENAKYRALATDRARELATSLLKETGWDAVKANAVFLQTRPAKKYRMLVKVRRRLARARAASANACAPRNRSWKPTCRRTRRAKRRSTSRGGRTCWWVGAHRAGARTPLPGSHTRVRRLQAFLDTAFPEWILAVAQEREEKVARRKSKARRRSTMTTEEKRGGHSGGGGGRARAHARPPPRCAAEVKEATKRSAKPITIGSKTLRPPIKKPRSSFSPQTRVAPDASNSTKKSARSKRVYVAPIIVIRLN